jgi:aryl sulfotransferase
MLLHFTQLKDGMPEQIKRIAKFLGIEIDDAHWPAIVEHCGFDYMKAHATETVPLGGAFWDGGAQTFMHKGTNARWRDILTPEDNRRYDSMARETLGEDCARWLATGRAD